MINQYRMGVEQGDEEKKRKEESCCRDTFGQVDTRIRLFCTSRITAVLSHRLNYRHELQKMMASPPAKFAHGLAHSPS